jgi:ParB family transcriptional regulator, chromosome partitioning protein
MSNTNNKRMFGLGKGLGSLIPKNTEPKADSSRKENVFYVEVSKIEANPDQPRQDFNGDALKELSASIKKYGVLQPLLVSKVENNSPRGLEVTYELIAGERRLRASKLAGLHAVPVIIRDDLKKDGHRLEVALIENIQRKDLNPMEEAEAYDRLQKEFGLTQQEIAAKVTKSREAVTNSLRLLKLSGDIKESLRSGLLSRAHARALLAFADEGKQKEVYNQILTGKLSSKEVEKMASTIKKGDANPGLKAISNKYSELEKNLADIFETPVLISSGEKGGKIVIKFATLQELNKIARTILD